MMSFIEKVERNCRLWPERDAIRDVGRRISYGELWLFSARVYACLLQKRLGPGDTVMIRVGNTIDAIIACVGVLRAGAAFVMAGVNQDPQSVRYMEEGCGCKLRLDDEGLARALGVKGRSGFEPVDEHAPAYVIYTSGSTRRPRGVMIERGAMAFSEASIAWQGKPFVRADDRAALLSPLTFTAGIIVMNVTLSAGATLVAVPGDTLTHPAALKRCFLDNRVTLCFMTPTLYRAFHDFNPEMRAVVLGGEPISEVEDAGVELYNMYGQSESGFVVAMQRVDGAANRAAIGTPQAQGINAQILDEAGRPVQDGDVGELCYENPWFRGYVGLEAETRRALRGGLVHSGDLCRRLPDGALLIMGRNDAMIKLHGLWFNPAEIEAAVTRCFDIDWVFVRCLTASTRVYICVYYSGKATLSTEAARKKLRGQLPDYMLPTHFYRLNRVPINRNGKVAYRALPSPIDATPTPGPVSPEGLEGTVADIVRRAMDLPAPIGRDANLISLGLSSLTSMVIIGEIEAKTGARLSLARIMAQPDIAHICEAIRSAPAEASEKAATPGDYLPLTKNQLALFAECEANKNSVQYNLPAFFAFSRPGMDAKRLEGAIRQVFDRHGAFRTRIYRRRDIPARARIDGCEVCQALTDEPLAIELTRLDRDFADAAAAKAHFQGRVRPYDLFRDRLYRIEITETPEKLYLFFDMHHIISDGYSLRLLADDITRCLAGEGVAPEHMTFAGYAARRAEAAFHASDDREYAEALMAGTASFKYPCRLPEKSARPHRVTTLQRRVAVDAIAAWCGRNGLTQSSYFHAALLLTLYLLTGEHPFIATTYSGRAEYPEALMRTVGCFAKSVPVVWNGGDGPEGRGSLRPEAFIRDVQAQVMDTCSRDGVLYSNLPARTDVLLTFQGELVRMDIDRVRPTVLALEIPIFPIRLEVNSAGSMAELLLHYDAALFSAADMGLLLGAYERVLDRLHSASVLGDIALVDSVDANLLRARSGPRVPIGANMTWLRDFRRQVAARPDALAVRAENGSYTYAELDEVSDRVAHWLCARGVRAGDFVAVQMPRVRQFPAAVAGIHKCGAAYVPVDEDYPEQRIAYILEDSGATVLVTMEDVEALEAGEHRPFPDRSAATGNAYMIYTSGSTGDPKGVVIAHSALYNYLRYVVDEMKLGPDSRISCYASFAFDISSEGLLAPLMAGGGCFIVPSSVRRDVPALEAYLRENGVTGGCFPTQIGQLLGQRKPLDMDYITLIGEKMTAIPGNRGHVYNAYGPTECTVVVTYYDVPRDMNCSDIPIGRPMYNTAVLMLDPFGNLLPDGAVGQLCVAGAQLARGYHNQPERTARAFAPLRQMPSVTAYHTGDLARVLPDGNLAFLGRADRQIKRRGYRIEPGEIESAALRQPGVREAVVKAVDDRLILYYTVNGAAPEADALVEAMKAQLPHYMLPDGCMRLEAMPLTPNGKIDARRLPAYHFKSARYAPPGNAIERAMCQRMADVLHVERVGIHDDFFDLGGNSLDAAQLALALGEGFEISDIYQGRTVSGILSARRGKRRFYGYDRLSVYPLTEEQKKFFFGTEVGARPEISYGNVPMLLQLPSDTDLAALKPMLERVIDNHPYLKVRYAQDPDPQAQAREWYVARRDDGIPAEVFLGHAQRLDRDGLIRPYNLLGDGNLYRAVLYDTAEAGKYLFLDFHHILIDEASWRVLLDDLKALMAGRTPVPEAVSGYEVALEERWRREEQRDEIIAGYRELLKDCDDSINNWIYGRRDIRAMLWREETYDEQKGLACMMGSRVIRVSRSRVSMRHVRARCECLRITENMFFNAAFACLLGELNDQSRALYANVIDNRDYAALERTVTMLCRTVPVCLEATEASLSTPGFLEQLRRALSYANRASVLSGEEICAACGVHFPILTMIYYDKPIDGEPLPGCRRVPLNTLDSIDTLQLKICRDKADALVLKYDASLDFTPQEIDRMAERMDQLLSRI